MYPEDATWEDYNDITNTFPNFHLEDKVSLDPPRYVITHDIASNNSELEDEEEVPRSPIVKIRSIKRNLVKPKWLRDSVQY